MLCKKCKALLKEEYAFCPMCGTETKLSCLKKEGSRRPNGTGYIRKRGGKYQLEIILGKKVVNGKLRPNVITKSGFTSKTEAAHYAETLKSKSGASKKKNRTTLRTLWNGYSAGEMTKLSKNTQLRYKIAFDRLSAICDAPVSEININDLQTAVSENTETYYPAKDMKNLLSHLYTRAQAQEDVTQNLSQFISLPDLEEDEPRPFAQNEIEKIWKDYGQGNKISGYILLMIYSGMMPGELFKCEKDMINWETKQIVGCGLKTKKRKQSPLLIADFMLPLLTDLCNCSSDNKLLYINKYLFYDKFHETLKRCEIKDRTPYACRHTTGTALALGNIAPLVIQEIMRHSKFSTTERYIHMNTSNAPMVTAINSLKD